MSNTTNMTTGFVDLATFDEIDRYSYANVGAVSYFNRQTKRSTWFTQIPCILSRCSGNTDFGGEFSVVISRSGDYLLHTWLRVTLPAVSLKSSISDKKIRWTRNLMHNLICEASVTFNDMKAASLSNYFLDMYMAFTLSHNKLNGYNNMIGNVSKLINPETSLPSMVLNLPLPFFFSRDSGVALPCTCLPFNEMRLNFALRDWKDLLIKDSFNSSSGIYESSGAVDDTDLVAVPSLTNVQVWANYVLVTNCERKKMGKGIARDILIEQVQSNPIQSFSPNTNANQSFDIRFSHSVKALFFAVRNKTVASEWSNYTTEGPTHSTGTMFWDAGKDPIDNTSLIYENTARLSNMGSDYFSLVQPYFSAPSIPTETGYHLYSYSLDFYALDPKGSTNFGKLINISLHPTASEAAKTAASRNNNPQSFVFIVLCVSQNVVRISGGALGFPIL